MTRSAEVVISLLELVETEAAQLERGVVRFVDSQGQRLRRQTLRFGICAGLALLGLVLMLTAWAMTFWGVFLELSTRLPPSLAALTTAGAALLGAVAMIGAALWANR